MGSLINYGGGRQVAQQDIWKYFMLPPPLKMGQNVFDPPRGSKKLSMLTGPIP